LDGAAQRVVEEDAVLERDARIFGRVHQKTGRVLADTSLSSDMSSTTSPAGDSPRRFLREPAWANGRSIVMTG
jgi:hypothetical protein